MPHDFSDITAFPFGLFLPQTVVSNDDDSESICFDYLA